MIRGCLLDLSGVLYVGDSPIPSAATALAKLQGLGIPVRYITNTSRSPRARIAERLRAMGFEIDGADIITAPIAVRAEIEKRSLRPFLLIHPDLESEFTGLRQEPPNAVVVGDAGEYFTYERMNRAFRLLMDGAPLLAVGTNRYFREAAGLSLDVGPFVAALEFATGTQAEVFGKPSATLFHSACAAIGCEPGEVVMVGDDLESDVLGALGAGLQAILVRTGKFRPADASQLVDGAVLLDDISAAVDWVAERACQL
ncbi:MAG: TIGR01458 family HAD-type hydrolase [Pseudomonadota bacterium]|nr:TIGR01458 family HAD-type hydrolase [Pseudomonadota bacterium]